MPAPVLPSDCLNQIFQYLINDKHTLYSCLRVNRIWCESVVENLWHQPFRLLYTCKYKRCGCSLNNRCEQAARLIRAYLACFIRDKRTLLVENKTITAEVKPPIFNYVGFLRFLDIDEFYNAVKDWLSYTKRKTGNRRSFFLKPRGDNYIAIIKYFAKEFPMEKSALDDPQAINHVSAEVICRLLMNHAKNLKILSIDKTLSTRSPTEYRCSTLGPLAVDQYGNHHVIPNEYFLPVYPGAKTSLSQLSQFICTTRHSKKDLFEALSKVSKHIDKLCVNLDYPHRGACVSGFLAENIELAEEAKQLGILISAQSHLLEFELRGCPAGYSFIMSALRTQSKTLSSLTFLNVGFAEWEPLEDLAVCTNLTTLRFQSCCRLSNDLLRPITNTVYRKLETLDMNNTSAPTLFLDSMIENANSKLRYLDLGKCDYYSANQDPMRMVIAKTATHCQNLIYFGSFVTASEMPQVVSLVSSCSCLETLVLNGEHLPEDDANWLLQRFASQELPNLRHFTIHAGWSFTPESLDRFLRGTSAQLSTLELSCSPYIRDEHLDVVVRCLGGILKELRLYIFGSVSDKALMRAKSKIEHVDYALLNPNYSSTDSVFCKFSGEWYQKPVGFYCRSTLGGFIM